MTMDLSPLRAEMVEKLTEQGVLRSDEWKAAFNRIPRENFVSRFYARHEEWGPTSLVDATNPAQRDGWLKLIYNPNETMVTQIDPASGASTSSSTMPRIVAAMLEALEVTPRHMILEIGTGTGYSTALLCERVGAANVTSIDMDPDLVELAKNRLSNLGYSPHLVASDGFDGYPDRAPYDRVIATCQVARVPLSWVHQSRSGGLIVAVLPDCMVRLTTDEAGGASGRMDNFPVSFMWMREHSPARVPIAELMPFVRDAGDAREPGVNVMAVLRGAQIPSLWPLVL